MKRLISGIIVVLVIASCESDYTRLIKSELAKDVRFDSLVFDIRFGDSKRDFYDRCWQLNKKGLITNGPKNSMVQYTFIDSAYHDKPTKMRFLFYGDFDSNGIMRGMDCEFSYPGWSPWNTQYWADSVRNKAIRIVEDWYGGNKFIEVPFEENQSLWVKVDGNRRIVLKKLDEQYVSMKIHNLLHDDYRHSDF